MGVQGLWSILQCTGKDIDLSSLQGKILAIDISIWLNQALKSNVDVPSPHLQLIFRRVCKLLYYRIKPVFVFDGPTPQIKKLALDNRRRDRQIKRDKTEKIKANMLNLLMKKNLVKKEDVKLSVVKRRSSEQVTNLFDLPPEVNLAKSTTNVQSINQEDYVAFAQEYVDNFESISDINIEDDYFLCLPLEVQHEVIRLLEKEKRYGYNCRSTQFENKDMTDFSNFQIERMLKLTKLQQRKEQLRIGMNEREVSTLLSNKSTSRDDQVNMENSVSNAIKDGGGGTILEAKKIVSSENKEGYILMIDLQKQENNEDDCSSANASIWRDESEELEHIKLIQSTAIKNSNIETENDDIDLNEKVNETSDDLNWEDLSKILVCASKLTKNNTDKSILNTSSDLDTSTELDLSQQEHNSQDKNALSVSSDRNKGTELEFGHSKPNSQNKKLLNARSDLDTSTELKFISQDKSKLDNNSSLGLNRSNDSLQASSTQKSKELVEAVLDPQNINKDGDTDIDEKADENDQQKLLHQASIDVLGHPLEKKDPEIDESGLETISEEDVSDDDFLDVEDEEEKCQDVIDNYEVVNVEPPSIVQNYFPGDELERIASDFSRWEDDLDFQFNEFQKEEMKLDKQGSTVAEMYYQEAKELLRLFGIPYVNSPGEAEAQCAWLENHGLVDGTITEDSDVWLFGGRTVYKHVFATNMTPRMFTSRQINKKLGLTRDLMVCIALLSGSDYTAGIYGVGPVIAMEILADFSDVNSNDACTIISPEESHIKVLDEFRKWHQKHSNKTNKLIVDGHKKRYLRFELNSRFPDQQVFNAYNNPLVDESEENFQWGKSDNAKLVELAESRFSWPRIKTIEMLQEVFEKSQQKKDLFDYFSYQRKIDPEKAEESSFVKEFLSNKRAASKRLISAVKTQKFHNSPTKKSKKNL